MIWVSWLRTIFMLALDLGLGAGLFTYFRQADSGSIDAVDEPSPSTSDELTAVPAGVGEDYAPLGLFAAAAVSSRQIPVVLIHGLGRRRGRGLISSRSSMPIRHPPSLSVLDVRLRHGRSDPLLGIPVAPGPPGIAP